MATDVKPKNFSLKHKSQPSGHSLGVPVKSNLNSSTGAKSASDGAGIFRSQGKINRNSGVAGAHRIGKKK